MEGWQERWTEVHRRETEKQIAQLAIEKQLRKEAWWAEVNKQKEWQREQDKPQP